MTFILLMLPTFLPIAIVYFFVQSARLEKIDMNQAQKMQQSGWNLLAVWLVLSTILAWTSFMYREREEESKRANMIDRLMRKEAEQKLAQAEAMLSQKKCELALTALNHIHQRFPAGYKTSYSLVEAAKTCVTDKEKSEQQQIEIQKQVDSTVENCRRQLPKLKTKKKILTCLEKAITLKPDDLRVIDLIKQGK